jgi:hypothetical protein
MRFRHRIAMIVAIHQPNYAPWLGYFAKLARADTFVFLDDVQFSKNSYINRVQIDAGGAPRWLTIPVSYGFGDAINRVRIAATDWQRSHLDSLRNYYRGSAAWSEVWPWLVSVYESLSESDLAIANEALVIALAEKMRVKAKFLRSSSIDTAGLQGDDRLIAILRSCGQDVVYLSGSGGAKYQAAEKFDRAGIVLNYNDFAPDRYDQGRPDFLPGLSIYDSLFRLGFARTEALLAAASLTRA